MKKLLFCMIALAGCASISAFANGSGYNGPDLHPVSIPVALDRGISIPEIENAITACLIVGDSGRGLRSTMEEFADQLGSPFDPSMTKNNTTWTADGNSLSLVTPLPVKSSDYLRGGYVYQTNEHVLQVQLNIKASSTLLVTGEFFPYVTYGKVLDDGGYDAFGNPDISKRIVSQLAIQVPNSFQDHGQAMPLVNYYTKQTSAFTVNAQEYVQCLQAELQ
jgi:hypothetical protein